MAREQYESLLRCPMCGRTGLADMSDDKSSKIGDYDTRIEAVTQGFEIKGKDVICSGMASRGRSAPGSSSLAARHDGAHWPSESIQPKRPAGVLYLPERPAL